MMLKKGFVVMIAVLLVAGMIAQAVEAGDALAEETIDVRVNVPVMQQMEVIELVVVDYDFSDAEDEVTEENAGAVKVKSNAGWQLGLENVNSAEVDVLVRRSDAPETGWQYADSLNGYFQGSNGSEVVEFDVKVKPAEGSADQVEGTVELSFTLQEI